jgi:hypothetical protein
LWGTPIIIAAKRIANDWVNALYHTTFEGDEATRLSICCITSFCFHQADQQYERDNGLLSQWRGYGGTGGYCLIFDNGKIRSMLETERATFFYVHLDLRAAHYFLGGTPLIPLFPELIAHSKEVVEAAVSGNREFSVEQLFLPFVTSATTTKHRGFYEEREVRIVAMPGTKFADDGIKDMAGYVPMPIKETFTTARDERTRRHISLFGKQSEPLPIKRVIVGPSRDQEKNVELARKIIGGQIPVVKSETPFLG